MNYQNRLLRAIPGGAHTYSRGFDQYPSNAPEILVNGKGSYIFDVNKKKYLDYGMALRAVNIGYAEDSIDSAAIQQIRNGNNLTKPSLVELHAAELLIDLIDSVDMVKFTKNGSTAVTAAIKLARAYTGKNLIARCADHPFFSYDDWFIGSTPIVRGIPESTISETKTFFYNDINSLQKLIDENDGKIACVILEAATTECPSLNNKNSDCCGKATCSKQYRGDSINFLQEVQNVCKKNGVIFILDEMITGFRWHLKGAQYFYNIKPDLCTFGKAMANGYSVACVAGRRELMELGGIEKNGLERTFLLSTTHGAEMNSLGAFIKTVEFIKENNVINHLWDHGYKLINLLNKKAKQHNIENYFQAGGVACSPWYKTFDQDKNISLPFRTLFSQEMISNGILMPWIALCWRHTNAELKIVENSLDLVFSTYKKALLNGIDKYLIGPSIKPVFRKYN